MRLETSPLSLGHAGVLVAEILCAVGLMPSDQERNLVGCSECGPRHRLLHHLRDEGGIGAWAGEGVSGIDIVMLSATDGFT